MNKPQPTEIPKELEQLEGLQEFFALLETPDTFFDAMYPSLKATLEEQLKDPYFQKLIKDFQSEPSFKESKKIIQETLNEITQQNDLSENKKDLLSMVLNIFTEDYFDAIIKVQVNNEEIQLPVYTNFTDAGADIRIAENITIAPNSYGNLLKTGISVAIPIGWQLSVRPRSGLSKNTTLRISNSPGTIDTGYRGEIGILVDNIGNEPLEFTKGDRIAQLILERVYKMKWEIVNSVVDIGENRGGGFGQSGLQ